MDIGDKRIIYSVIVPVYNTQKYLKKCVDSILAQSFCDFELILIDDGSTDLSGEMCDEYEKKYDRIHVFHQQNKGASSARNCGINNARGEYIVFVDSDDYVQATFLENLYSKNDADLIVGGYSIVDTGENNLLCRKYIDEKVSCEDKDRIAALFLQGIFNYAIAKCYKSSVIRNRQISFDEKLTLGEDTNFVLSYLRYINNIKIISATDYRYVQHEGERLTKSEFKKGDLDKIEINHQSVYNNLLPIFDKKTKEILKQRNGLFYSPYINSLLHTPNVPYSFFKYLFKQESFRMTLEDVDWFYSEESERHRRILKKNSALLFWLYYKYVLL